MTKINEILTLDLQEDIKNVIDLEDRSELEIQQEIESYIVTEGIGRHLYNFTNQFTSNIKETGVWLSGFYGSGKSYFGKMLGYIIDNPTINGTPARERFIPRLKGVSDESLIENSIRNLEAINSRVVFLDVAKQNTDRGLAFTLFANLLKNLGFRDDIYGYIEFDLFIDGKLDEFKGKAKSLEGQEWDELKTSNRQVARVMRKVFAEMGYSEADYADTQKVYSSAIEDFSASKFKTELEKHLKSRPDETLVFVFDEASEAISQKKFTLLDLEGISEALSSISNKVWTIAIAQEKLDNVINNANVNRSQLTKVTDRFKTKVHLESTEVDVIIRSRLLHWYWFKQSNVIPQQRMHTLAMEFLADMIREILMEDEDGIIPLVPNAGEKVLLDRIEEKFREKGFSLAQYSSFDSVLGRPIHEYLNKYFFAELSDHLNLFMYLPKTPFIWHLSSGPEQGFDCYIIIYKWSRDKLMRLRSVYIEHRERSLVNRQSDLSGNESADAQNEKDRIFRQLKEIKAFKAKIDELLAEGYNPILDDGVGKNIAPLQKKKMIPYEVLNARQLKKYLNADW